MDRLPEPKQNLGAIQCNRCFDWIVATGGNQKYCQACAKIVARKQREDKRKAWQQQYRHKRIQDTLGKVFELRLKQHNKQ